MRTIFAEKIGNYDFDPDKPIERQSNEGDTQKFYEEVNVMKCAKCKTNQMTIKKNRQNDFFVGCSGWQTHKCRNTMNMAKNIKTFEASSKCPCCSTSKNEVKTIKFTFDEKAVEERKEKLSDLLQDSQGTFCVNNECEEYTKYKKIILIMSKS